LPITGLPAISTDITLADNPEKARQPPAICGGCPQTPGTVLLLVHGNKNQRWDYTKTSKRLQALTKNHPCPEVGGWNKKDGANINIW